MEDKPLIQNDAHPTRARTSSRMATAILVVSLLAVGAILTLTRTNEQQCGCIPLGVPCATRTVTPNTSAQTGRPRLLDLGADKCIPCKKMAPILDELKQDYAGRMDVEFIDVWHNTNAANRYGIESIPTQIFFDATGKELYRHEGFIAKEDILEKWKELGVEFAN